jgi:hypothetical protein
VVSVFLADACLNMPSTAADLRSMVPVVLVVLVP